MTARHPADDAVDMPEVLNEKGVKLHRSTTPPTVFRDIAARPSVRAANVEVDY